MSRLGTDTRLYLPWLDYSESQVTLGAVAAQILLPNTNRILVRFQLVNADPVSPITGIQGRVSSSQDVTALSGFPVTFNIAQEFHFTSHGKIVTDAWYGVLAAGIPILQILEVFWKVS